MNDRPTPETDGAERMAFAQEYMVPTDFARKIERERDEAIADRDIARFSDSAHDRLVGELAQALRERDEARNKMADALQEVDLRTLDYLRFREAIIATLEENRHLADGDDCTLAKLKSVVPDWK